MNRQEQPRQITRDIFLLVLGALMSSVGTLITLHYTNDVTKHKEKFEQRSRFIEDVATNSGRRLNIMIKLYKANQSNDPVKMKENMNKFDTIQEIWNERHLTYFPLMRIYFGDDWVNRFDATIYERLLTYGKIIKDPKFDIKKNADLLPKLEALSGDMDKYFNDLYFYNDKINNPDKKTR